MEKGGTATMLFHYAGVVSEERYEILSVKGSVVTLRTDEDPTQCFRFDSDTGKCLNDNTAFGAKRTLKLSE